MDMYIGLPNARRWQGPRDHGIWATGQTRQAANARRAGLAPWAAHMMPRVRMGMVDKSNRRVAGLRRIRKSPIAPVALRPARARAPLTRAAAPSPLTA